MRCPKCGSKMFYRDTNHKLFSAGKAVAGAITFGVAGVAAGFIGKDEKCYRCGTCGAISSAPMDFMTAGGIDRAVEDARSGKSSNLYNTYKNKWPGIEDVAVPMVTSSNVVMKMVQNEDNNINELDKSVEVKASKLFDKFIHGCPVHLISYRILTINGKDTLSIIAQNVGDKELRSAYLSVRVLDDVGDEILTKKLVYQQLQIPKGAYLPTDVEFDLDVDYAYSVDVKIEKAAYCDDSVWRNEDNNQESTIEDQILLTAENFPKLSSLRSLAPESIASKDMFLPIYHNDVIQCVCSTPFLKDKACSRCGLTNDSLQELFSYDALLEHQKKIIHKTATERQKTVKKKLDAPLKREFTRAKEAKKNAKDAHDIFAAAQILDNLGKYNSADVLAAEYRTEAKELALTSAYEKMKANTVEEFSSAINLLLTIPGYKNSEEILVQCKKEKRLLEEKIALEKQLEKERVEAERKKQQEETERRERKAKITKWIVIACSIIIPLLFYFIIYPLLSINSGNFKVYINMYNIEEYTIPDGTKAIKAEAFKQCDSLKKVNIPDSVTSIGDYAFYWCDNLTSVTVPDTVTYIGDYAFTGCSFSSLTIPKSITSMGTSVFANCDNLTNVVIENGVTFIGENAFGGCDSLVSITIPDSVTSIGESAFEMCAEIEKVTLGKNVKSLGENAFAYCKNLKTMTIPKSLTNIGKNAFDKVYLRTVYYTGSREEWERIKNHMRSSSIEVTYYYNP